jgi:lipid A oxidase
MRAFLKVIALLVFTSTAAVAQTELSFYGGTRIGADSRVSGNDPGGAGAFSFLAGWQNQATVRDGNFGLRMTWWQSNVLGWGLDYDRSALRASNETLSVSGLSALEFSNGSSLLTVNAYRRWRDGEALVPYVGAGVGVAIPKVVFQSTGGTTSRFEVTGPAVQWYAGASIPVSDRWSVFGEYKGSFSSNVARLDSGGSQKTNVLSSALNVGVSLGF